MQTALILMTILGCADAVTQCNYIATASPRYTTVALCDAASAGQLARFTDAGYPSVVAVCQKPADTDPQQTASVEKPQSQPLPETVPQVTAEPETQPGIAARAVTLISDALPTLDGIRTAIGKPSHYASASYSWLARKITD